MITSKVKMLGAFNLPAFAGDQLYMHPIDIGGNWNLPASLARWVPYIQRMLDMAPTIKGRAFVTIDQKEVKQGHSQRRPGPHVDGNFIFDWGGGGGWLTGENGRILEPADHRLQYCSPRGGMLIASDFEACRAWRGRFDGEPGQGGNCEHMQDQINRAEAVNLQRNTAYWMNSTGIHESLPVYRTVQRSLLRITLPHDAATVHYRGQAMTEKVQKLADAAAGIPVISTAPRWECALAYLFGKRFEGRDGSHYCIVYQWRGKTYVTESSLAATARDEQK